MALDPTKALGVIQNRKRKEATTKSRFKSLISSVFALGTVARNNYSTNALALPASGNIGISCSVAISQGELLAQTSTGKIVGTPDLAADQVHHIGYFEKGVTIKIKSAKAGTGRISFLDERREANTIASGTFT